MSNHLILGYSSLFISRPKCFRLVVSRHGICFTCWHIQLWPCTGAVRFVHVRVNLFIYLASFKEGEKRWTVKPLISSKNTGAPQISNLAFFRCLDNSSLMQLGQVLLQPGSSLPWQSEQVLTFLVNNLNHTMQEMPLWNQLKNHAAPCLVRRLCTSAPKNHGTSFQRSALHEDLTSW